MSSTPGTFRLSASLVAAAAVGLTLSAGCAPLVLDAAPPERPSAERVAAELDRLALEGPALGPPEGVVFSLEPAVETSTEGLASEPLETAWQWGRVERATPILPSTGTVAFDLPQSDDSSVEAWVGLLEGGGRRYFRIWLARSTRYVPLFYEVLDRYRLPRDLVYLAMVESGFSPRAFSWASAAGPWQFIPTTARRYGLRVGFWVDERRDFEKSSEAAARHLTWLYSVFEDWHLAMAAYNAGAGGVKNALRRSGREDFWTLRETRRLRRETKQYVPKILASARIGKAPEAHGFDEIPYQPRLAWETVAVPVSTSLATIGEACGGLPEEALEELNPALRVSVTPPGEVWPVRVPPGFAELCAEGLAALPPGTRETFRHYEPGVDEPLDAIAARFGTTKQAILRFHGQKDELRMLDYAEIAVPVPLVSSERIPIVAPPPRRVRGGSYGPGDARLVQHRVRSGDSLWKVSQRYDVPIAKLRAWNGLWRTNTLRIGQRLKVYVGRGSGRVGGRAPKREPRAASSGEGAVHRVREGESLWIIAQRYGTTVDRLRSLNELEAGSILSIGQSIRVR